MANHENIEIEVRSNISALSSARLHQALVEMVQRTVEESTAFLHTIEPKRTGELVKHTNHSDALEDVVGTIEAHLGVTPIEGGSTNTLALKTIPGAQETSHYPLFVDRGTGVFGPTGHPIFARTGHAMHFEEDGRDIFARSVAGQRGQHFMAATEAFAEALLHTDPHIRLALDEMAAEAAAMLPEIER